MDFEILAHVSETGVRAYGTNLNQAFANAARAMFSIITDLDKIQPKKQIIIKLAADNLNDLLVEWLNELLFRFDTDGLVFNAFEVQIKDFSLEAVAIGEKFDPEKHPLKTQIKAATYYNLEVKENKERYVQVYFDV